MPGYQARKILESELRDDGPNQSGPAVIVYAENMVEAEAQAQAMLAEYKGMLEVKQL